MNKLFSALFTIMIFGLLALSVWYVGIRLQTLFELHRRWPIQIAVAAAVIGAMAAIIAAVRSSSPLAGALNVIGGYVFTFYIFLLFALICLHAIQIIWPLPIAWSRMVALALALVVTVAGALWANSFAVNESEIRLPGLNKEVSVMHISDVHLGYHHGRDYLEEIVKETNRRNPVLVIITGDLVDSNAALMPGVLDPLSDFTAPVYFVGGNHEKYVDTERVLELISQQGVHVLHNEVVETNGLQLVGLDYMNADDSSFEMHPSDDPRTIKSVLAGLSLKTDLPSVLMHHSPVGAQYVTEKGIDLMLSGHTHAGQVFPFTLFNEVAFPFNRGLYQQDITQVFVSQGAGSYMLRVRLGTSNEINLLRLVASS